MLEDDASRAPLDFLSHNCCPATCLVRVRSFADSGGYDEAMRSGFEDWDFFLSLLHTRRRAYRHRSGGAHHLSDRDDVKQHHQHVPQNRPYAPHHRTPS